MGVRERQTEREDENLPSGICSFCPVVIIRLTLNLCAVSNQFGTEQKQGKARISSQGIKPRIPCKQNAQKSQ